MTMEQAFTNQFFRQEPPQKEKDINKETLNNYIKLVAAKYQKLQEVGWNCTPEEHATALASLAGCLSNKKLLQSLLKEDQAFVFDMFNQVIVNHLSRDYFQADDYLHREWGTVLTLNFEAFEQATKEKDAKLEFREKELSLLFMARNLATSGNKILCDYVVEKTWENVERFLHEGNLKAVEAIINLGEPNDKMKLHDLLCKRIKDADEIFGDRYVYLFRHFTAFAMSLLSQWLSKENIKCTDSLVINLIDAWSKSADMEKDDFFQRNMVAMKALEQAREGACLFLYENYGICDFDRYPKELLLAQIERHEDKETPYGVIAFPQDDHNGAFYHERVVFENLFRGLKGKFNLRVIEADTKQELLRRIMLLNEQYNPADGSGQKIAMMIIGGHGTKDTIQFGDYSEQYADHLLTTDDLKGDDPKGLQKFFIEKPTIILSSCSTGIEGGVANQLSAALNAKVLAPDVNTHGIRKIMVKQRADGRWSFNVGYMEDYEENQQDFKRPEERAKRVYMSGSRKK